MPADRQALCSQDGRILLPRKHEDAGFNGYIVDEHLDVQRDVYLFTADSSGLDGLGRDPWIRYLEGDNSGYPLDALHADIETFRNRLEGIRKDSSIDYQRPSDNSHRFNSAVTGSLVQLMLVGTPRGRREMSSMRARSTMTRCDRDRAFLTELPRWSKGCHRTVSGFALSSSIPGTRRVVVQAAAYGEHGFTEARAGIVKSKVDGNRFAVEICPKVGDAGFRRRVQLLEFRF